MNFIIDKNKAIQKWTLPPTYCELCTKEGSHYGYGDYTLDTTYHFFKTYKENHIFCDEHEKKFRQKYRKEKIQILNSIQQNDR